MNPLDGALSAMAEHRSSLISCSLNSRYMLECNFNSAPRLLRMGRESLTPLIYWMNPSEACTAKKEAIESRWLINVRVNNISMAFCKLPSRFRADILLNSNVCLLHKKDSRVEYRTEQAELFVTVSFVIDLTLTWAPFRVSIFSVLVSQRLSNSRQIWSRQLTKTHWTATIAREWIYLCGRWVSIK